MTAMDDERRKDAPIPWLELSHHHRRVLAERLAEVLPLEEPAEHWRKMSPAAQWEWQWMVDHPHEAQGAYEDEMRRLDEGIDADASSGFEALVEAEPGHRVLDDVRDFVGRFVAFPTEACLNAVTLWVAHSHLISVSESTPRLAVLSPEPGSGKTRVLEVLELLVPTPMSSLNASPAAIFRSLAIVPRTLLFDEVDAVFRRHGKDDGAEDLRALLNAGHRRGATIPRCVPPAQTVTEFPVFAPAAMAGLGDLPDTLMSRSIVIRMRRRLSTEVVEQFRRRLAGPEGTELRSRLAGWSTTVSDALAEVFPDMPPGVTDRPADVWEPLLAVADAAGGHWPDTARTACLELVRVVEDRDNTSLGVLLLRDLRSVIQDDERHVSTEDLLERLIGLEESPWGNLRGSPLDPRGVARLLRPYGIKSTKVRVGKQSLNGYVRSELWDAWERYLPSKPERPELGELQEQGRSEADPPASRRSPVPEPAEASSTERNRSEQEGSGRSAHAGVGAAVFADDHPQPGAQDLAERVQMPAARVAAIDARSDHWLSRLVEVFPGAELLDSN